MENEKMCGVVKWLNYPEGYGFISGHDGVDVYVSASEVIGPGLLDEGMKVEYEKVQNRKFADKFRAQKVKRI